VKAENECPDNGKLTSVELDFPETPALVMATPSAVTGWSPVVNHRSGTENTESIVWTNSGQVDGDGTFPIELASIPEGQKTIDFKALDTCDNGEVTRWIEPGEDSEHPAPVLTLTSSS